MEGWRGSMTELPAASICSPTTWRASSRVILGLGEAWAGIEGVSQFEEGMGGED